MNRNTIVQLIIGGFLLLGVIVLFTVRLDVILLDIPRGKLNQMFKNDKQHYDITPANLKKYNDSAYICNETVCCRDGFCFHLNGIVNDTYFPAFYNLSNTIG